MATIDITTPSSLTIDSTTGIFPVSSIGGVNTELRFNNGSGTNKWLFFRQAYSTADVFIGTNFGMSSSSGTQHVLSLTPLVVQGGGAGWSIYHANPTTSTSGSGVKRFADFYLDGAFKYAVDSDGKQTFDATNTTSGTTGAQTINKPSGTVNFAASDTSLIVTNSLVTASSIILCTIQTNDSTLTSVQAVPASGSFILYGNAAATAETVVGFLVIN